MDFVWILVGGFVNRYMGENKIYALVEYEPEKNEISLSDFRNCCSSGSDINTLETSQSERLETMLSNGRSFLCKKDLEQLGYYNLSKNVVFSEMENREIKCQLMKLLENICIM